MTLQEAYERMRAYLTRPGAKLATHGPGGACAYLAPDGHKCAVGCLLTYDALAAYGDIHGSVFDLINRMDDDGFADDPIVDLAKTAKALRFLAEAQRIHDSPNAWEGNPPIFRAGLLDYLAERYGLTVVAT